MADPQAWAGQFSHQHWFDHSTSRRGIQPQPQPGLDLATVPSHDSDTQTDRGLHHVEYSLPQWQALTTHGSGHTSFNSEASMSQPVGNQCRSSLKARTANPSLAAAAAVTGACATASVGSNRRIAKLRPCPLIITVAASAVAGACITTSVGPNRRLAKLRTYPLLTPAVAACGSAIWKLDLGLTPPSLPQLQAYIPHPVSVPTRRLELGAPPLTAAMAASAAQFEGPESELIPPLCPNGKLPYHTALAGAAIILTLKPFHPHYSLSDTHNSESPIDSFQTNIAENFGSRQEYSHES
ncbi:hypothetical protein BD769DRAFT_1680088 [Suillus cothurnatus]|nr:hypothetical protein BD769DRAFT_1680088 [Suillus cothurnatus]